MLNGFYGIANMNPAEGREEVSALIGKIQLIPNEAMENRSKGTQGTKAEITLKNGERIVETV